MRQYPLSCGNVKCMTTQTPLWRKGWVTPEGKTIMLCNACGLHFKKGHSCCYCNQIYRESDADDSSNPWIGCDRCSRWIHQKCEEKAGFTVKSSGGTTTSYMCPDCRSLSHKESSASSSSSLSPNPQSSFSSSAANTTMNASNRGASDVSSPENATSHHHHANDPMKQLKKRRKKPTLIVSHANASSNNGSSTSPLPKIRSQANNNNNRRSNSSASSPSRPPRQSNAQPSTPISPNPAMLNPSFMMLSGFIPSGHASPGTPLNDHHHGHNWSNVMAFGDQDALANGSDTLNALIGANACGGSFFGIPGSSQHAASHSFMTLNKMNHGSSLEVKPSNRRSAASKNIRSSSTATGKRRKNENNGDDRPKKKRATSTSSAPQRSVISKTAEQQNRRGKQATTVKNQFKVTSRASSYNISSLLSNHSEYLDNDHFMLSLVEHGLRLTDDAETSTDECSDTEDEYMSDEDEDMMQASDEEEIIILEGKYFTYPRVHVSKNEASNIIEKKCFGLSQVKCLNPLANLWAVCALERKSLKTSGNDRVS